jgi:hypothetical protein
MSPFFVLMPGSWPDADSHLCRPLLGGRKNRAEHTPLVAVARGLVAGGYDFVARSNLGRADGHRVIAEAAEALQARPRTWQVAEKRGFLLWKRPSMVRLIVSQPPGATPDPMDDLSCEQILNPTALAEAADQLGSQELLAVVPKRGWLLLLPGKPGEIPQMMLAHQVASGVFERGAGDALSPYAFFVRADGRGADAAGRLLGLNVFDGTSGTLSLVEPDDSEWLL